MEHDGAMLSNSTSNLNKVLCCITIFSLPMVAYPRLSSIKLSDLFFLLLAINYAISYRDRLVLPPVLKRIVLVFLLFALYGCININIFNPIHVNGGWNEGFLSEKIYHLISFSQILFYVAGSYILGKKIVSNRSFFIPLIADFFIFHTALMIILYIIPVTKPFVVNIDLDSGIYFLSGTFTEKGPFGSWLVFMLTFLVTSNSIFKEKIISEFKIRLIFSLSILAIVMSSSTRCYPPLLAFGLMSYSISLKSDLLRKLVLSFSTFLAIAFPLLTPILINLNIPFLSELAIKIEEYSSFLDNARDISNANGRYAGAILFPSITNAFPWLGIGHGNYIFYRSSREFANFLQPAAQDQPGNFYLQTIMEMGILGSPVLIYLVALMPLIKILSKKDTYIAILPFCLAFILYLVEGISYYYQTWLWFSLLIVMIEFLAQPKEIYE